MRLMHLDGLYITVGSISLNKTFGGSVTQQKANKFLKAALTS